MDETNYTDRPARQTWEVGSEAKKKPALVDDQRRFFVLHIVTRTR